MPSNEVPFRPVDLLFPGRREAISARKCIEAPLGCGGAAISFDDEISEREYEISGLCQKCQKLVFDEDAGEDR
jgi:hypothetical protein